MELVPEHEAGGERHADCLGVEFLDHNAMDWSRIRRSVYEVQQRFRYQYAAPISELRQRLVVMPRPVHGNQRLLHHRLEVSEPGVRRRIRADRFGNVVFQISIPKVEEAVDFDVSLIVERSTGQGPHLELATTQALHVYLLPSALTRPDAALRAAAAELELSGKKGAELAIAASGWVYRRMSYGFDRTGVHTTAGEALAEGHGVCQDYAHVMLALCRLLGLPARYVSGHLVGEGGTHAWVEVLLPVPGAGEPVQILAWDPTHDRAADLRPHRGGGPRLPRRRARLPHLSRAAPGITVGLPPRRSDPSRARDRQLTSNVAPERNGTQSGRRTPVPPARSPAAQRSPHGGDSRRDRARAPRQAQAHARAHEPCESTIETHKRTQRNVSPDHGDRSRQTRGSGSA